MSAGDPPSSVRLGVDFDNTLVCYDRAFARLAEERSLWADAAAGAPAPSREGPGASARAGEIAAASQRGDAAGASLKQRLRDHLRATGREDVWTELQGVAYGARIGEARPFDGALDCLRACARRGVSVFIVSHKTRVPYAGAPTDLRAAASSWLAANGFVGGDGPLSAADVFFESTREAKVARIVALGCTHFIDDLPEFLAEPALPRDLVRILFDPSGDDGGNAAARTGLVHVRSWSEVEGRALGASIRATAAGAGRQ